MTIYEVFMTQNETVVAAYSDPLAIAVLVRPQSPLPAVASVLDPMRGKPR